MFLSPQNVCLIFIPLVITLIGCEKIFPEKDAIVQTGQDIAFEALLQSNRDLTYDEYIQSLPKRNYVNTLDFDPTTAKYYHEAAEKLDLNAQEKELFKKNGFVSIDHDKRYSFASSYYGVWTRDLPVLITTSSLLHALHKSYDDILKEMETQVFTKNIEKILSSCHQELSSQQQENTQTDLTIHYQDIDLFITVARNLLRGAGAPSTDKKQEPKDREDNKTEGWDGSLLVTSVSDQDDKALQILTHIQQQHMQVQGQNKPTQLYGSARHIDYSQFIPRGHYTSSTKLKRYFRTMMWLGRADTGMNIRPTDPNNEADVAQADRELRNSILFTSLLYASGMNGHLKNLDDIIGFMVGKSDNLNVFDMHDAMNTVGWTESNDLLNVEKLRSIQMLVGVQRTDQQQITAQSVVSDVTSTTKEAPPALFHVFGQRFVIDSFALSKVVFDNIIFEGKKQKRTMASSLDAMVALGNHTAVPLLEGELRKWNYSANLKSTQELIAAKPAGFWNQNLYNLWLNSLRVLDDDMSAEPLFPQAMKTKAWQRYQLQTQLASWAELRHDTILYSKMAYGAVFGCEYPHGYVEPYPEFYQKLTTFADTAAHLIEAVDYGEEGKWQKNKQIQFFTNMSSIMQKLEIMARKELQGQAFTPEEVIFMQKWIDMRRIGSGGQTRYDGYYCQLFYSGGESAEEWKPTVSDVYTDPNSKRALEVATGDINYLMIAVDNGEDKMVYIGPTYSYYEFTVPVQERMTDEEWAKKITAGKIPKRPEWTSAFQGPKEARALQGSE